MKRRTQRAQAKRRPTKPTAIRYRRNHLLNRAAESALAAVLLAAGIEQHREKTG